MPVSPGLPDYYATLQVREDADHEVIEAAYRQLMKKYHPDRAAGEPRRASALHERAKVLNEAYAVLRNPASRRAYDLQRTLAGPRSVPRPGSWTDAEPNGSRTSRDGFGRSARVSDRDQVSARPDHQVADLDQAEVITAARPQTGRGILGHLAAAYYLLPGRYEWEPGHGQEVLATLLIPPLGIAAWALATGRLNGIVGEGALHGLVAWSVLLIASLPLWRWLPRLIVVGLPSVLLLSGVASGALAQSHVPEWLAWGTAVMLGSLLSARLYVFGVLPTLGACWTLARLF